MQCMVRWDFKHRCNLRNSTNLRSRKPLPPLGARNQRKDWQNWPMVKFLDKFNFPIKTLDAYNYYMNGWIDKATVFKLQSLSATPAKHWVAVKTEEIVVSVIQSTL